MHSIVQTLWVCNAHHSPKNMHLITEGLWVSVVQHTANLLHWFSVCCQSQKPIGFLYVVRVLSKQVERLLERFNPSMLSEPDSKQVNCVRKGLNPLRFSKNN